MTFSIYTLGCKVNSYESNVMHDLLINEGYKEASKDSKSDIVIINTCSVTNTADSKSLKLIKRCIKENEGAIVVVCGCYSQANSEVLEKLDGVSVILGTHDKSKVVDYIKEFIKNKKLIKKIYDMNNVGFDKMMLNNFDKTRAFVKIEDGCENFCSFCIIPYLRGKVRSKDKDNVIDEIKTLVGEGHHEIVLTGIHTGHYGADLDNYDFSDLLEDIIKIDGLERLRISSIEINELNDKFMEVLKKSSIIVDHIHIPIQSGCDKTLKDMNRKYDLDFFKKRIGVIRSIRPEMSISTDLIVGFPGETEEDFNITLSTLEELKFSKIHCFPFSVRKGTKAETMDNQVKEEIKKERVRKVIDLSTKLEKEYMEKFVGRTMEFIPEVFKDGYFIGHTGNYLQVKVKAEGNLTHESLKCRLIEVNYPYIMGSLIDTHK